ncbi:hypothetical protein HNQ51_001661 [Inhella inkyongensis]|uniref:DUF354 domain-containing protein n=1 Tax=Inhella inkyongensis TaxID=392593 RepID=A0A840RZX2_9BURK|nr:DUF354 domain-containing protein [Inhella inkyongensis]MBB5204347.1 hypothetical protein [Inhella inkyongensis]
MKIWFDLSNSPHINLFAGLIRELEAEGHEITITCRPLANTIDLLDLHGFRYTVVGTHYGAKLLNKLLGFPIRCWQLWRHLRGQGIHAAISQSSFHSPVVARLLGVRVIYMNDNEHALGNVPAFLFATRILVPECLALEKLKKQGANPRKVTQYPGVKEGIYLWALQARLQRHGPRKRAHVYVRPEPWTAQYYKGQREFLDELLLGIKDQVDVTLLPRGQAQGHHYRDPRFAGIRIIDTALDLADIAPDCDLFIGAGGTMTREMAVLGVPTLSVYQDELLDVDRHLLDAQAFCHMPRLSAPECLAFLAQASQRPPQQALLDKGRAAHQLIKQALLEG